MIDSFTIKQNVNLKYEKQSGCDNGTQASCWEGKGHFNPHGCQAKEIVFKARPGHNTLVGLIGGIPKKSKRPWRQRILAKHAGGHAKAIVEQKHAWALQCISLLWFWAASATDLRNYYLCTCRVAGWAKCQPYQSHVRRKSSREFYFHSHSSLGPMKFQLNL